MKITVIHPSRGRAKQAHDTYLNWLNKSDGDFEYIASWDSGACEDYYRAFFYNDQEITICLCPNKTAIEAINNAAEIATGDLFVVISDDFDCPEHWDTLLLKEVKGKRNFCLKTDDGLQPTLITLPIMDCFFYASLGYVYHPDYTHMFCDQEMTAVAIMSGRYQKSSLLFPHNHYSTGKFEKDAISVKNDRTWASGQKLFNQRLKTNFGIANPVVRYSEIKWR